MTPHSATRSSTSLIVLWWAFPGLYFGWYRQIAEKVKVISTTRGMAPHACGRVQRWCERAGYASNDFWLPDGRRRRGFYSMPMTRWRRRR